MKCLIFVQMRRTSKALDWLVETIGRKTSKPKPALPDIDEEREKGVHRIMLGLVRYSHFFQIARKLDAYRYVELTV